MKNEYVLQLDSKPDEKVESRCTEDGKLTQSMFCLDIEKNPSRVIFNT